MNFSFVSVRSFPEVTPQRQRKHHTTNFYNYLSFWVLNFNAHESWKYNTRKSIAVLLRWFTAFALFSTHIWSGADQNDGSVGGCSLFSNLSKALLVKYHVLLLWYKLCLNNALNWVPHLFKISGLAPVDDNFSHLE